MKDGSPAPPADARPRQVGRDFDAVDPFDRESDRDGGREGDW